MKRILFLLVLSSFSFAYSQINERNGLGWNSVIYSGVVEYNDTLTVIGIGTNASSVSKLFSFSHLNDQEEYFIDTGDNISQYYLPSPSIINNNRVISGANSVSNKHNFILCQKNLLDHSFLIDSFEVSGISSIQIYDVVANSSWSEFIIGTIQNTDDLITNGFILKFVGSDTLWTKKYSHPELEVEFSSIKKISEDRMLVGGRIYDWDYNSATIPVQKWDDEHHTYIAEMDTLGNVIWEWNDTTNFTWMPFAIAETSDGGIIYATQRGVHSPFNGIYQGTELVKLNSSHEKEWVKDLGPKLVVDMGSSANRMAEILQVNDSTFVIGGSNGTYINPNYAVTGTIIEFTDSGRIIWRRDYVPPVVEDSNQVTVIYDMAKLNNGGFAMVGESRDSDGVGAYQQGWLLTTNCLGYLAPPSAACITGNLDNYCIRFANSSLQGGEFEWDFGDTQVQTTNEDEDTIVHIFSGEGPYNVRLIAKGCNGEADTIYFDVNPTLLGTDEQDEFGEGTFDVYPNPAGSIAYVSFNFLEELNNANIIITDLSGKTVQSVSVNQKEFVQELNLSNFSQGVYMINFMNDGNLIKSRRLLVK